MYSRMGTCGSQYVKSVMKITLTLFLIDYTVEWLDRSFLKIVSAISISSIVMQMIW